MTGGFTLQRVSIRPEGAFGVLLDDGVPFAVTVERTYPVQPGRFEGGPHKDPGAWNQAMERGFAEYPKIAGDRNAYQLVRTIYYKRSANAVDRVTYEVKTVHGHDRLLLHVGNVEDDSEGCILVGESFDPVFDTAGITASRKGFEEFLRRATGREALPRVTVPFTVRDPA